MDLFVCICFTQPSNLAILPCFIYSQCNMHANYSFRVALVATCFLRFLRLFFACADYFMYQVSAVFSFLYETIRLSCKCIPKYQRLHNFLFTNLQRKCYRWRELFSVVLSLTGKIYLVSYSCVEQTILNQVRTIIQFRFSWAESEHTESIFTLGL